jgi:hypothetical protein
MKTRQWLAILCGGAFVAGATLATAQGGSVTASGNVDGLIKAASKDFDQVYLRPGTDFRSYTTVMLTPSQVVFADRWLTEMNSHPIAVLQGTSATDAEGIAADVRSSLRQAFTDTFRRAGYDVVTAPGADVLALSVNLADLYINAPRTVTQALPSRVYTPEAGQATLMLEVRDATTGALLARFVDKRTAGVRAPPRPGVRLTTQPSNQFDFESLFGLWAQNSVGELKTVSPLAMNAPARAAPR